MIPDSLVAMWESPVMHLPLWMWVGIEWSGLFLCESFYQMAATLPAIL